MLVGDSGPRDSCGALPEHSWAPTRCLPGSLGAVPELGWMRKAFFSLPLTMLYVMRPEEPPVCTAWMLATAVPGRANSVKGPRSRGAERVGVVWAHGLYHRAAALPEDARSYGNFGLRARVRGACPRPLGGPTVIPRDPPGAPGHLWPPTGIKHLEANPQGLWP